MVQLGKLLPIVSNQRQTAQLLNREIQVLRLVPGTDVLLPNRQDFEDVGCLNLNFENIFNPLLLILPSILYSAAVFSPYHHLLRNGQK